MHRATGGVHIWVVLTLHSLITYLPLVESDSNRSKALSWLTSCRYFFAGQVAVVLMLLECFCGGSELSWQ